MIFIAYCRINVLVRGFLRLLIVGGVAGALTVGVWWSRRVPIISPPVPARFTEIDPMIVGFIRTGVSRINDSPRDHEAWRELGMIYQANRIIHLSRTCYEQAIALEPDDARSWLYLAMVQDSLREREKAMASMRRCAELDPLFPASQWRLGLWLLEMGELDAAESRFRHAIELDPIGLEPQIGLARVHLQRNENEQAVSVLSALLQVPSRNEGYISQLLGMAFRRLGRTADADLALARSTQSRPVWTDPWEQELGRYQMELGLQLEYANSVAARGRLDEAVRFLNGARNHRPDDPSILIAIATCYSGQSRFADAVASLEEALKLRPDSQFVNTHLAVTHVAWARQSKGPEKQEHLNQAMQYAQNALRNNPTFPAAHGVMGDYHLESGRIDDAIESYLLADQYDENSRMWLKRAAIAQFDAKRWNDAATTIGRLAQLIPFDAEAWYLLGRAEMMRNRFDEAGQALDRAQVIGGARPEVTEAMAELAARRSEPRPPSSTAPLESH